MIIGNIEINTFEDAMMKARNLVSSGDYATAELIYQELIKSFINVPIKASVYYDYACLEAQRQNLDKTYELIKKALEFTPFYEGYLDLGKFDIYYGKIQSGIKNIEKALIYNNKSEECKSLLTQLNSKVRIIKEKDNDIKGFYEKSKDYKEAKYKEIYPEEAVHRELPKIGHTFTDNEKKLIEPALEGYCTHTCQESFVINIPNGSAYTHNTLDTCFFTKENMLLADIKNFNNLHEQEIVKNKKLSDPIFVGDNLLVLTTACGGSNYHWITTVIPRLHLIKKAGYKLKDFDKIIVDYIGFRFQKDIIFNYLQIPEDKLIGSIRDGARFKAKNIVTASIQVENPKWSTMVIRDKLLKPSIYTKNRHRLYISRNDAKTRRILNENSILNFLGNLGFKSVCLDGLSFDEQVSLFANAEAIISPHGAALTNLLFCRPETKVIEIMNPEWFVDCYTRISNNIGLDYCLIIGNPQPGGNSDMIVDMQRLENALNMVDLL